MRIEIIHCKEKNTYKILHHSTKKHPALQLLANLLRDSNHYADVKAGIFMVQKFPKRPVVRVTSYISGKSEIMRKTDQYPKFLLGKRQIYVPKPKVEKAEWNPADSEKELEEVLGAIS